MKGFVKVEGVIGDCTEESYRGWMELLSFSHGIHRQGTTTDRADHMDVSLVKYADRASPLIALAVCNGRHFREARVVLCHSDGAMTRFMEIKLTDVTITSYRPGASTNSPDSRPIEEFSLHYEAIDWIWLPAAATGKPDDVEEVRSSWTLKENAGSQ